MSGEEGGWCQMYSDDTSRQSAPASQPERSTPLPKPIVLPEISGDIALGAEPEAVCGTWARMYPDPVTGERFLYPPCPAPTAPDKSTGRHPVTAAPRGTADAGNPAPSPTNDVESVASRTPASVPVATAPMPALPSATQVPAPTPADRLPPPVVPSAPSVAPSSGPRSRR